MSFHQMWQFFFFSPKLTVGSCSALDKYRLSRCCLFYHLETERGAAPGLPRAGHQFSGVIIHGCDLEQISYPLACQSSSGS